ncbi:MAG: AAA family ATPase [Hyphomonas sp.]|nr:AAA family ATPase [Hyphomonas sp.]
MAARDAWAIEFREAAKQAGLHVVAVTDHHDVALLDCIARAFSSDADIDFLPGVEILCHDGVQCLAIFDPSLGPSDWQRFLGKFRNFHATDAKAAKIANPQQCGASIGELFAAVRSDTHLRDRLILLPHFGNEDAHRTLNVRGQSARFRDLDCDAVYVECAFQDLLSGTLDKVQGRIPDWGGRRRAIVPTGDNKRSTYERLGKHTCWIKLGEIGVEGLRQAFLADEARVCCEQPSSPPEHILSMEVRASLLGPDPICLVFNDGFNALVGGRGSGKSSMLEYLRFGLGRTQGDLKSGVQGERSSEDIAETRIMRLVKETLADGFVEVSLQRGGAKETWRREGARPNLISIRFPDGSTEEVDVPRARDRFAARAFHQKELSTTMVDQDKAADNLTGIAAADIVQERRALERQIADAKRMIRGAVTAAAAHWAAKAELARVTTNLNDARRRYAAAQEQLGQGGVEEEDLRVIGLAPVYGQGRSMMDELDRRIFEFLDRLNGMIGTAPRFDVADYPDALRLASCQGLVESVETLRSGLVADLTAARDKVRAFQTEKDAFRSAFQAERSEYEQKVSLAKAKQTQHQALIGEAQKWAAEATVQSEAHNRQAALVKSTEGSISALQAARAALHDLVSQKRGILTRCADEVAQKSEGFLKAKLQRDRDFKEALAALRPAFEGSRIRDIEHHVAEWVKSMAGQDRGAWTALCDALLSLFERKAAIAPTVTDTEIQTVIQHAILPGHTLSEFAIRKISENLTEDVVVQIISAVPSDAIKLAYISEEREIAFQNASPGQQASALLRLLLKQQAGTLIVDQPEDDLDNKVLMEIVKIIRFSKSQRQLIFATHNPNLVVNGDADKVVVMKEADEHPQSTDIRFKLDVDGAIETPEVRQAITQIMEGGREAFDMRARKYKDAGQVRA